MARQDYEPIKKDYTGVFHSISNKGTNKKALGEGFVDGFPIGLGYFAVSFSLGITAKLAGLSPFQGFLASLLNNASAGEYAAFTLIGANASYLEVALITLIANARYLLMSCALSQRFAPDMPIFHRFFVAFDVTDEIFAITINRPGMINPFYTYGAILIAAPCWSIGTACGVIAGNILPLRIVSALSVALYGMFLAVIIPPVRKNRFVGVLIVICFVLSAACSYLPGISSIASGTRTIILTVLIAAFAAWLRPVPTPATEDSGTDSNSNSDSDLGSDLSSDLGPDLDPDLSSGSSGTSSIQKAVSSSQTSAKGGQK